jgi:cytochrome c oxidase assembly factor CtaG
MSHPVPLLPPFPWPVEPSVWIPVVITGAVYLRGWGRLRRRVPQRFGVRHAAVFLAALVTMLLTLSSPVDTMAHRWLSAHMVQHLLLMVVVAPMVWMGAPVAPLLVGLPRLLRKIVLGVANAPASRRLTRWLLHPSTGWIAFALAFWVWHAPALYDLALDSDLWHHVEHACFLVSALLFWRPVILAWPAQMIWPRWTMVPYLGLAMFQSLPLAAILTFSDRVIYTRYSSVEDQALAGVIMWVPGSIPLLLPILRVIVELSSARVAIEDRHA